MDKFFSAIRQVMKSSGQRGRWNAWWLAGVVLLSAAGCDAIYEKFHLKGPALEVNKALVLGLGASKLSARDHGAEASPPLLSTYTPTAPFLGNQTAIVGGALDTSSAPSGAILVRETNCTLTQYGIGKVNGTMSTITATLPNADAYLHKLSGLTTTVGTFPKGCADRTKGIPSAPGVYLGQAGNGDLLSAAVDSGKITLLRFTTLGVPVSEAVLVAANAANTLAAIDLNGDGIADIVTPYVTANGVSGIGVFLSRADGSFNPVTVYGGYPADVSALVAKVSIEDVNGDGKLDIVGVGGSLGGFSSPTVVTLLGAGNGTFTSGPISVKAIDTGLFVLADFNGDGRTDLLTAGGLLMTGNGDGSFGAPLQRLNVPAFRGRNIAVGDFDGDGKLDVALRDGNIITILLGRGDGTFAIKASYAAAFGADYLSITDIDGDGNADIVVGLTGPKVYGPNLNSQTVTQFMLGRGDGTFAAAQAIPGVGISLLSGAPTFALADFNGDGFPDVIASNAMSLIMRAGTASANFAEATTVATLGFQPLAIASGDIDGDGKLDLIVGGTQLAVFKGMGNGAFGPAQIYNLPGADSDPRDLVNLAVADFNGDGRADVLVIRGKQSGTTGGAFVYFGNADGTLKAPVQIDTAINLSAVAVGDLNGDKRADIAVGGLDPQFYSSTNVLRGVRVYRGNADGSFSSPLTLNPGVIYTALAIGDLNKDGKNDLVVASRDNSRNDTVFVLPGLGDGTCGAATSFPLPGGGPGINSIAIGDFSSDGNADVMYAGDSYSGFLVGNGDGTLSGPSAVTIASGSSFVAVADLNKDAKIDAVMAVTGQGLVPLVQTVSAIPPITPPPAADFTIAITSNSGSVSSGQSAQTVLNLAFGSGFTQTVAFSCAGLPANARCSFNPASVTPGSGTPSTTVTISTGGVMSAWLGGGFGPNDTMTWGFIGIGSIGLAAMARRRRRMTWRASASLFFAGLLAIGLVSCGGDDNGNAGQSAAPPIATMPTPSGAYTVTISATAGAITKSVIYSLTVK